MTEIELIALLTKKIPRKSGHLKLGIGDDCSILNFGKKDILISVDQLAEGIHFKRGQAPLEIWGAKGAAAAVSDIAAMGGKPRFAWVALSIPDNMRLTEIRKFYEGLRKTFKLHKILIAGGNITRSPKGLGATFTILGEIAAGRAMRRSLAKPGEQIFVSGLLGRGSFLPKARVSLGEWLAAKGCRCCIDVSDGLLQDLRHIAVASKVKMVLNAKKIPFAGKSLRKALTYGEDYELAFTFDKKKLGKPPQKLGRLTEIGEVKRGKSGLIILNAKGEEIKFKQEGFQHRIG